jgi:hypothetical protein
MTKDTGGPAFPLPEQRTSFGGQSTYQSASYGMTLRDWFAGQALSGMLADPNGPWEGAAEKAYWMADLMIAERNKP